MSQKILDRVQKLIQLAAHPGTPEDEARNSAVKAVQMILEHKIQLSMDVDWKTTAEAVFKAATSQPPPPPFDSVTEWGPFAPFGVREEGEGLRNPFDRTQYPSSNPARAKVIFPCYVRRRAANPGICIGCKKPFDVNDSTAYMPKKGFTHWECRSHWKNL